MLIFSLTALAAKPHPCMAPTEKTAFLLTMTPGPTALTTFGHSAVLIYDPKLGQRSPIYDHGHFNSRDPWFAVDYLRGHAQYWGLRRPMKHVKSIYKNWGRTIQAQRLNLSAAEVDRFQHDQDGRVGDENSFDYRWYDNNCTTQIRDGLNKALKGDLQNWMDTPAPRTVRESLTRHAQTTPLGHAFNWGGGAYSDTPLNRWDASFMPALWMESVRELRRPNGEQLVASTCTLVDGGGRWAPEEGPDLTRSYGALGGILAGGVAVGGLLPRFGRFLAALFGLFVAGIAGIDLLFLLTGAGDPWWTHHNQALANPLALALPLWALGWKGARPFAVLVSLVALIASLLWAVQGFPHHNLSAILLVLPGLLCSLAVLERWHRSTSLLPSESP